MGIVFPLLDKLETEVNSMTKTNLKRVDGFFQSYIQYVYVREAIAKIRLLCFKGEYVWSFKTVVQVLLLSLMVRNNLIFWELDMTDAQESS